MLCFLHEETFFGVKLHFSFESDFSLMLRHCYRGNWCFSVGSNDRMEMATNAKEIPPFRSCTTAVFLQKFICSTFF
jgi:hypothetical protein